MHLFFLIRAVDHGGAERQLIELVKALEKSRFRITVATFYDGGGLRPEIENLADVRVVSLGKKGRWDLFPFLWRLSRLARESKPDVFHGYMGIANELCSLMGWRHGGRVVWGLRQSQRNPKQYDWLSRLFGHIGAWCSRSADLIIVNSIAGKRDYAERGYFADRMVAIHNGIDTERFHPDSVARHEMRCEWKIDDDQLLIGLIARLDPQKDHRNFLRAAALVAGKRPKIRFVCVGNGPASYARELHDEARALGLNGCLQWVPASNKVLGIYNALDLATLTSKNGEGFPNVVGEAMACGTPVVVTDAGDSGVVVGDQAQIVPIENPEALAETWLRVLDTPPAERARLGARQRTRIEAGFHVRHLVSKTVEAIERIR